MLPAELGRHGRNKGRRRRFRPARLNSSGGEEEDGAAERVVVVDVCGAASGDGDDDVNGELGPAVVGKRKGSVREAGEQMGEGGGAEELVGASLSSRAAGGRVGARRARRHTGAVVRALWLQGGRRTALLRITPWNFCFYHGLVIFPLKEKQ